MADLIKLFARAGQKFRWGPGPGGGGGGAHAGAGGDLSINLADPASWPAGLAFYALGERTLLNPETGAIAVYPMNTPAVGKLVPGGLPGLFLRPQRVCEIQPGGTWAGISGPGTVVTVPAAVRDTYRLTANAADMDFSLTTNMSTNLTVSTWFTRARAARLWMRAGAALDLKYMQVRTMPSGAWGPITRLSTQPTAVDVSFSSDMSIAQYRFFADAAGTVPLMLSGLTVGETLLEFLGGVVETGPYPFPVIVPAACSVGYPSGISEYLQFTPETLLPNDGQPLGLVEVVTSDLQYFEIPRVAPGSPGYPVHIGTDPAASGFPVIPGFPGLTSQGAHLISLNLYRGRPEV